MRSGDKHRTNRMFRRRIYAQGFTILAMLGGSIYWETDRAKRRQYGELVEEKEKREKHENWLKELEIRDQEEQELRKMRQQITKGQAAERRNLDESESRAEEQKDRPTKAGLGSIRSVCEESERTRPGPIIMAVRQLLQRGS